MSKRAKPLLREDSLSVKSQPRRRRYPAQPNLPFDPMPDRVEPCLALLKRVPPVGPDTGPLKSNGTATASRSTLSRRACGSSRGAAIVNSTDRLA